MDPATTAEVLTPFLKQLGVFSVVAVILVWVILDCKKEKQKERDDKLAELEYNRQRDQIIQEMQLKTHEALIGMKSVIQAYVRPGD